MAKTTESKDKKAKKAKGKDQQTKVRESAAPVEPAPRPRLLEHYEKNVRSALQREFLL